MVELLLLCWSWKKTVQYLAWNDPLTSLSRVGLTAERHSSNKPMSWYTLPLTVWTSLSVSDPDDSYTKLKYRSIELRVFNKLSEAIILQIIFNLLSMAQGSPSRRAAICVLMSCKHCWLRFAIELVSAAMGKLELMNESSSIRAALRLTLK